VGGPGEIAVGAAGALALVAVCAVASRLYAQRRWQRIIWTFKLPSRQRPKIIIETIAGETTLLYKRPSAGFGAVAAVAQLSSALNASRSGLLRRVGRALDHPVELSFSSEERADSWCSTADTVVVGGPKSNEITAAVMQAYGCQPLGLDAAEVDGEELRARTADLGRARDGRAIGLGVATHGNTIYWFGERYEGSVGVSDDPVPGTTGYNGHDYGVVLRLPSPTRSSRRTVVVFGSQTFGVDAASLWLVQLRRRATPRRIRTTMAKHRNVAVLVKAHVKDGAIDELELQDLVELPDHLAIR
jgi:hypothetical protein